VKALQETGWFVGSALVPKMKSSGSVPQAVTGLKGTGINMWGGSCLESKTGCCKEVMVSPLRESALNKTQFINGGLEVIYGL
jgi:hypothetical protein